LLLFHSSENIQAHYKHCIAKQNHEPPIGKSATVIKVFQLALSCLNLTGAASSFSLLKKLSQKIISPNQADKTTKEISETWIND